MATTVARLSSNGVYFTSGYFDEVTFTTSRVTSAAIFSSTFDEVNLQGSGVAKRETNNGQIFVSGYFDEVTGIAFIGSTASTVTPSIFNSVTIGTTNGSPFSTPVNSYQFATQPASAPYNYITVAGNSGFAMGTGDFTVEWFQYQTVAASFARAFYYGPNATTSSMAFSEEGSGYFWSGGVYGLGNYGTILNAWVHFAIVRIGTTLYLYKNGTLVGSATNSSNITDSTSTFYIGTKINNGLQSEQFSGSITSFRVIKGLGVYTGNFTKPTSPLGQTQSANPYGGSNTSAINSGQCVLLLNP